MLENKLKQEQKQVQKLQITQELRQALKILQMNSFELEAYVREEALSNPMLEVSEKSVESGDWADAAGQKRKEEFERYLDEDRWYNELPNECAKERDCFSTESYRRYEERGRDITQESLRDYLFFQLNTEDIPDKIREICRYIIDVLDENGYLTVKRGSIIEETGTDEASVESAFRIIRGFDPAGVAAESVEESLAIQIDASDCDEKMKRKMLFVLNECMKELADNSLVSAAQKTGMTPEEIQEIKDEILKLNPRPGAGFSGYEYEAYVIPEIKVVKGEAGIEVVFPGDTMPEVRISSYYRNIMKEAEEDRETKEYLTERLKKAEWIVSSISQRRDTILNIARFIVGHQSAFFEGESDDILPLALKDVAAAAGVHESTVSRTVNGKYLECEKGIFELKYFFSGKIPGNVSGGGAETSAVNVKRLIEEIIADENPKTPFSDQVICTILEARGIDIARRTVAKYREQSGIPSSARRKRY